MPQGYPGAPLTAVLIGELVRQGHEVVGITVDYGLGDAASPMTARGPRFEFHVLPGRTRVWRFDGRYPGRALDMFRRERRSIAQAIRRAAPDVVHAHWTYEFALGALQTDVPHVITAHDAPAKVLRYTRSPYRAVRYLMAREVLRRARCLTAVSDYMGQVTEALASVPVGVVPNPLAREVLSGGRVRSTPSGRRIGMVCNGWGRIKNPQPALRAFHKFCAMYSDAELHLFGSDFGPGQIAERWVRKCGLGDGMVFHGSLPHRDLIRHLENMDVLLHPSLEESFGVVVAEAMALGLPVVAGLMSGAIPWVVGVGADGQSPCAVLTRVRDDVSIVAALERVFDQRYGDRSAAAFARARAVFDPGLVAQAYVGFYEHAIAENMPAPGCGCLPASQFAMEN